MYSLSDIKEVHLELTERCQAACPMCDRNIRGEGINPHIRNVELTLADIKKIFTVEFLRQLKSVQFCGNYGDPIIAEDLLPVIKYFKKINPKLWISINTNAGARSAEWWKDLAHTLDNYGRVIFSVDGLKDTNHLYRQNVKWDKVERAMRSFISAGGRARWDFLVFDHNQHQVEEAEKFSKELGFEIFTVKKSSRFVTAGSSVKKVDHQASDRKGNKSILIKESQDDKFKNKELDKIDAISKEYGSMDMYYEVSEIDCKVKKTNSLYISAEGIVLPCCWTAGRMYKWWHKDPKVEQIWDHIDNAGGKDSINAKLVGLKAVFDTLIFENIQKSWDIKGSKNGRLKICSMKCSKDFDPVFSQYK